jgi:hypothetical protein
VLCPALTHQGKSSPKTKQPVHRSDLPFHQFQLQPLPRQFQLQPVPRWFQLHPMQFAVPPHFWTGPILTASGEDQPALTAAALPPLTANCNRKS